jgi:hypothetical protein
MSSITNNEESNCDSHTLTITLILLVVILIIMAYNSWFILSNIHKRDNKESFNDDKTNNNQRFEILQTDNDKAINNVSNPEFQKSIDQCNKQIIISSDQNKLQLIQPIQMTRTNPPVQTNQTGQLNQTIQQIQTIQSNQKVQPTQTMQQNQLVQSKQLTQSNQTVQTNQTTQPKQSIQTTEQKPKKQFIKSEKPEKGIVKLIIYHMFGCGHCMNMIDIKQPKNGMTKFEELNKLFENDNSVQIMDFKYGRDEEANKYFAFPLILLVTSNGTEEYRGPHEVSDMAKAILNKKKQT